MSDTTDVKTEKIDHKDYGPMGKYNDENKPFCMRCESQVFVIAVAYSW